MAFRPGRLWKIWWHFYLVDCERHEGVSTCSIMKDMMAFLPGRLWKKYGVSTCSIMKDMMAFLPGRLWNTWWRFYLFDYERHDGVSTWSIVKDMMAFLPVRLWKSWWRFYLVIVKDMMAFLPGRLWKTWWRDLPGWAFHQRDLRNCNSLIYIWIWKYSLNKSLCFFLLFSRQIGFFLSIKHTELVNL